MFLIGVWLLYNVVLLSAVQQSESAISIDVSPLSWISFLFTFSEALEGNLHTLWFFTSEHFSVDFLGIGRWSGYSHELLNLLQFCIWFTIGILMFVDQIIPSIDFLFPQHRIHSTLIFLKIQSPTNFLSTVFMLCFSHITSWFSWGSASLANKFCRWWCALLSGHI